MRQIHTQMRAAEILLVEDNQDARNMLERMLQRQGFEVATAADGPSGLELFQSFRPNVAIVDIGLPVIDGFQVAREVRKDPALRSTRLIALTGYGRDSDRREALDAGFDAHLIKPLNPGTLLSLISAPSPE